MKKNIITATLFTAALCSALVSCATTKNNNDTNHTTNDNSLYAPKCLAHNDTYKLTSMFYSFDENKDDYVYTPDTYYLSNINGEPVTLESVTFKSFSVLPKKVNAIFTYQQKLDKNGCFKFKAYDVKLWETLYIEELNLEFTNPIFDDTNMVKDIKFSLFDRKNGEFKIDGLPHLSYGKVYLVDSNNVVVGMGETANYSSDIIGHFDNYNKDIKFKYIILDAYNGRSNSNNEYHYYGCQYEKQFDISYINTK